MHQLVRIKRDDVDGGIECGLIRQWHCGCEGLDDANRVSEFVET
jgi:hypothetical protein